MNHSGTHVARAARIEPITPPGLVYASEPFAARVKGEGIAAFAREYVKLAPLAKEYGTFPTFLVKRRTGACERAV
jgi:hypothetical protein